jgi:hypothetical protein
MEWGIILPSLVVGAFGGWLYGSIKGHNDTQQQLEQQERRMLKLLAHIHRSQLHRLQEMDIVIGMLSGQADKGWGWRRWAELRAEEQEERTNDEDGFFAEMHRR